MLRQHKCSCVLVGCQDWGESCALSQFKMSCQDLGGEINCMGSTLGSESRCLHFIYFCHHYLIFLPVLLSCFVSITILYYLTIQKFIVSVVYIRITTMIIDTDHCYQGSFYTYAYGTVSIIFLLHLFYHRLFQIWYTYLNKSLTVICRITAKSNINIIITSSIALAIASGDAHPGGFRWRS